MWRCPKCGYHHGPVKGSVPGWDDPPACEHCHFDDPPAMEWVCPGCYAPISDASVTCGEASCVSQGVKG